MNSTNEAGHFVILVLIISITSTILLLPAKCDGDNKKSTKDLFKFLPCNSSTFAEDHDVVEIRLKDSFYTFAGDFGRYCIISNKNITLIGASPQGSDIICSRKGKNPTQGIAFINSTVLIEHVTFVKCGAPLNALPSDIISLFNNSLLYYSSDHAAALVFIQSLVKLSQTKMNSSYGFSAIGIDLLDSMFDHIHIMFNIVETNSTREIGYGFLLHFANSFKPVKVELHNSFFDFTFLRYKPLCFNDVYAGEKVTLSNSNKPLTRKRIVSTTIFTILYTEKIHRALVTIQQSYFFKNFGWYGNCLLIVHYGTHCNHSTVFSNNIFKRNYNQYISKKCRNRAQFNLIFNSDLKTVTNISAIRPLKVQNTQFLGTKFDDEVVATYNQIAMYIGIYGKVTEGMNIELRNVTFKHNLANGTGVCLHIESKFKSKVSVLMESVTVTQNRVTSLFPFESMSGLFTMRGISCYINGSIHHPSTFEDNYGIVLDAIDATNIYISGYVYFNRNKAINGPAIYIKGDSRLYFIDNVTARFEGNRAASLGGAIYAVSTMPTRNGKLPCAFHFDYESLHPNSSIVFLNNNAVYGGKSIYAFPIVDCYVNNNTYLNSKNSNVLQFYNTYFSFRDDESVGLLLDISTLPVNIKRIIKGSKNPTITHLYPGQATSVCLCATDQMNRQVYSSVELLVPPQINNFSSDTWLLYKNKEQVVKEGDNCTEIHFSLNVDFVDKEYPLRKSIFFYTSTTDLKIYYTLNPVYLLSCPLGFSSSSNGFCTCSKALNKFSSPNSVKVHCNIERQVFTRSPGSWVGLVTVDSKTHFAISTSCPFGHCVARQNLQYFYVTNNEIYLKRTMMSKGIMSLCHSQRTGPLCGKCMDGLSIVFGTNSCYKCSRYVRYWLFIAIISLLGPLFVLALFILKITLTTGTINGIVFYANVLDIDLSKNLFIFLTREESSCLSFSEKIVKGFLPLLNFRFGFPVCFLKEMDELQKAGISIVFPFYLLIIVLLIIIVSRYSLKVAKTIRMSSVQVLVTVVHFSISKILLATTMAFSSTTMYTDDKHFKVWYYDDNVLFLKDPKHLYLAAFTLVAFVVFVIPYYAFLLFTKKLSKHHPRFNLLFRPIYEAVHAPFKPGREYWFSIRMIILALICLLDAYRIDYYSQKTNRITAMSLISMLLIGQCLFHPFKHRTLSFLDNWALLNLTVVYGMALIWYDKVVIVLVVSGMLITITAVAILLYHIMWVTGALIRIKTAIAIFKSGPQYISGQRHPTMSSSSSLNRNHSLPLMNDSLDTNSRDYESDGFREPLLAGDD